MTLSPESGKPSSESALERYSATVGILGDGVAVLDADGVVRSLNPAGERLLQAPASMLVGKRLLDTPWRTINEDGTKRPRQDHPALVALRTGEAQMDVRVGLVRPTGEIAWIAVTAVPLEDKSNDEPIGVVVSFRDVSRRQATEVALVESQRKLDLIFNSTNDFIVLIAVRYRADGVPEFVYEAVNRAYCEMISCSIDNLVGRTFDEALPADRAASGVAMMTQLIASDTRSFDHVNTVQLPRGRLIIEFNLRVIEERDGRPSQILSIGRDVSRQAESEAQLRASEEQFRAMASSMADGVVITDLDDHALYVNGRVTQITGFWREELVGTVIADKILTPEGRAAVARNTSSRRTGESNRYAVEMIRKDGARRWLEIGGAPLRDAHGKIVGTVGTMTDVTDRRSADEMREQMVSVVSHELRTPLTALSASLKLLAREVPEGDQRAEKLVSLAVRNADRMLGLVNDLLDLERLESSASVLKLTDFPVAELIEQAIELLGPLAAERQVRLIPEETTCIVRADRERVSQVLLNLIANAIKFSHDGGPVRIGTQQCAEKTEIFVRDEGRGIPEDRLPMLFRRFAQVHEDDSLRKKGAGLGLAISRAIVEQHGGRIWAENAPNGGSVFRFTLPSGTATASS
ncbi:MAG TPA: PAS domain S-box protein [Gemmatimonadaceae bacterium]